MARQGSKKRKKARGDRDNNTPPRGRKFRHWETIGPKTIGSRPMTTTTKTPSNQGDAPMADQRPNAPMATGSADQPQAQM